MVIKNHTIELGIWMVAAIFASVFGRGKVAAPYSNHGLAKMVFGYELVN